MVFTYTLIMCFFFFEPITQGDKWELRATSHTRLRARDHYTFIMSALGGHLQTLASLKT
jgi:hypothetical protein